MTDYHHKVPDPELDLGDIISVWKKNQRLVISLFALATLIAVIGKAATPRSFTATALVYVEPFPDHILSFEHVRDHSQGDLNVLNSLEAEMVSDAMILRVVAKAAVRAGNESLATVEASRRSEERLISRVRNQVECRLLRGTRLLRLTVRDRSPDRAQELAKSFADEYEKTLSERAAAAVSAARTQLLAQVEEAQERAMAAEAELHQLRADYPEISFEQDHDLISRQLSLFDERLTLAAAERVALAAQTRTLDNIDPVNDPVQILELTSQARSQHIADLLVLLANARAKVAENAQKFAPRHLEYRSAMEAEAELQGELIALAISAREAVKCRYINAKDQEEDLRKMVELNQEKVRTVKRLSGNYRGILARVESAWKAHQTLQSRIAEMELSEQIKSNFTRLVSPPLLPDKPSFPRLSIFLAVGWFLSGLTSFCILFLCLITDQHLPIGQRLERALQIPVVAQVNSSGATSVGLDRFDPGLIDFHLTAAAYGACSILVTNLGPQSSTSNVAERFARTLASLGHETLLITRSIVDGISESLQAPREDACMEGESRLLSINRSSLMSCDTEPSFFALSPSDPAVTGVALPSETVLNSARMSEFLTGIRTRFQRIVIDGGSLNGSYRAMALAGLVDLVAVCLCATEPVDAEKRHKLRHLEAAAKEIPVVGLLELA